jgi:cell division protease FtsH
MSPIRRLLTFLAITFLVVYLFNSFDRGSASSKNTLTYSQFQTAIATDQVDEVTYSPEGGKARVVLKSKGEKNDATAIPAIPATPPFDDVPGLPIPTVAEPADRRANTYIVNMPANDSATLSALTAHKVPTTIVPKEDPSLFLVFLLNWGPMLIIAGVIFWSIRRSMSGAKGGPGGLFQFGKMKNGPVSPAANPIRFKDVAGCEEAKADVEEVATFLKNPEMYERVGGKIPKGILMAGPPGTGKTLLAKAIAGEAGVPFFSAAGSDFVEMFVGTGAARVRDLFEQAKANAPCIIFIDEIDAVGRARSQQAGGAHEEREQTLNAMLVAMDGFGDNSGVIVIAATNRPDVLDPALLRPGRFDREVNLGLPDREGRAQILAVHGQKVPVANDVDWDQIAGGTPGFSGAELANLINEAALYAARSQSRVITRLHFEEARDKIIMGAEKARGIPIERERRTTAYHEAGHTIVAMYTPQAEPLHKVSIVPRGRALGVTVQMPKEDVMGYEKEALETRLTILMGGRAAEEVAVGAISTGASNDFERASQMARAMVTQWGMSDELGVVSFGEQQNPYRSTWSETWLAKVDEVIHRMVNRHYSEAKQILKDHKEELENLTSALLEFETLSADEIVLAAKGLPLGRERSQSVKARQAAQAEKKARDDLENQGASTGPTPPPLPGKDGFEGDAMVPAT